MSRWSWRGTSRPGPCSAPCRPWCPAGESSEVWAAQSRPTNLQDFVQFLVLFLELLPGKDAPLLLNAALPPLDGADVGGDAPVEVLVHLRGWDHAAMLGHLAAVGTPLVSIGVPRLGGVGGGGGGKLPSPGLVHRPGYLGGR